MKPKRTQNQKILRKIKGQPCVICGKSSDPCHIKTRGSGGPDEEWNLLPMCRLHHIEQGQIGWHTFAKKHPIIKIMLSTKGWVWDGPRLRRKEYGNGEKEKSFETDET